MNIYKALPSILLLFAGASFAQDSDESLLERLGLELHGFLDARLGTRLQEDPYQRDTSLAESRFQLDLSRNGNFFTFQARVDFHYDDLNDDHDPDFEEGTGAVDPREFHLLFSPTNSMDVKIGRQILTWGTGDLVFINDLFPKDWQSFFTGRDEAYLKAPSDAVLVSLFPRFANIDIAYIPRFDADRYIRGQRISYWNPALGGRAGRNAVIQTDRPDDWFEDDELSVRVSRNVNGYELALYGYDGFWKSPMGSDPTTFLTTFPQLRSYGLSMRGGLGKGVLSMEAGVYDSRDDQSGGNPYITNGEYRFITGFEWEAAKNLTVGIQYYLEYLQDYNAYLAGVQDRSRARDEDRHLTTLRLTKLAMNQNLTLSLFAYYGVSDKDYFIRPIAKYKLTDAWQLSMGANLFGGDEDHTFFAQFEKNTNIYASARYSF